jgi:hypothetical protein
MKFVGPIEAYHWAISHRDISDAIIIRKEVIKICQRHTSCPSGVNSIYCPYEIGEDVEEIPKNIKGCLSELVDNLKRLGYIGSGE